MHFLCIFYSLKECLFFLGVLAQFVPKGGFATVEYGGHVVCGHRQAPPPNDVLHRDENRQSLVALKYLDCRVEAVLSRLKNADTVDGWLPNHRDLDLKNTPAQMEWP